MQTQDTQLKYELECDAAAAAARLQELTKAAVSGDADAPRAQKLTAKMHAEVVQLLSLEIDVKTRGMGGKYKTWLRKLGPEKAALIAIRECIQLCTATNRDRTGATAQLLTSKIGRLYELEVRIIEAEEVNPMYMDKIHEQVKNNATTDYGHLRRLYNVAYDRVMKGELDSELSDSECAQIGKFGVDACWKAGLIALDKSAKAGVLQTYTIDEEIAEFLTGYDASDVHGVVDRGAGAMMCEPIPWTGLSGGGYLSPRRQQQFPLMALYRVRKAERKRIREAFTAERMPVVFECANYLQSIPYEVHMPTLTAVQRVWNSGGGAMGLPPKAKPLKPAFPFPDTWVKEDATEAELAGFTAWKHEATAYYTSLKEWRGHTMEFSGFLKMGRREGQKLWFPVMMDTRGRWYYNGTPNPQGSDVAKAALHFANKKPLGREGLFWLKVQIANSYGYDKVRMSERVLWVEENWQVIERALDAPEDHTDVWGDSPWCMYAASYELREALRIRNPETYVTGIPVHVDATCSGLQHFSAMLRDPVGGKYVNLFDAGGTEKQDIYRRVADGAVKWIKTDVASAAQAFWSEAGITRAQAKKPVMTYVYGATLRGTSEFLEWEALQGREDSTEKGERNVDVATYGAKALFAGIEQAVPAAASAMRWLREVCRTVPKATRMEWTAPTGFRVQHDYQEVEQVRVRINACGVNRILFHENLDECNPHKMQNAIAPNFVHSLDASHLTFTALEMKRAGTDFVGIHDSFGTHPCDVAHMNQVLREQFVRMYTEKDVLLDFLWEVGGTGEVPKRGNLELSKVMSSEFFFC